MNNKNIILLLLVDPDHLKIVINWLLLITIYKGGCIRVYTVLYLFEKAPVAYFLKKKKEMYFKI